MPAQTATRPLLFVLLMHQPSLLSLTVSTVAGFGLGRLLLPRDTSLLAAELLLLAGLLLLDELLLLLSTTMLPADRTDPLLLRFPSLPPLPSRGFEVSFFSLFASSPWLELLLAL
ncbi:hypothetical protein GGR51DRAFT_541957 [Nemania sp. FL0031]|nr:hypothetical protein GGR51DRAFT_541957 [Nemania sp. FL0031]